MKIEILSSAMSDLMEGRQFYEEQGKGLGEYFFDSLFSDIDSLTLYAGIHPVFYGYHRMLSKRFPYAVYYKLKENSSVAVWR
ncbi:MAG: type II toxin-antitoxin system RelE/ParE family toxin, partial [Desulfotignum sp.]